MKAQGKIKLYNLETNKIQKGGGTHIHGRKSTGQKVSNSSAGCIVPYKGGFIKAIVAICKDSGIKDFNLTVFMVDQFKQIGKVKEL